MDRSLVPAERDRGLTENAGKLYGVGVALMHEAQESSCLPFVKRYSSFSEVLHDLREDVVNNDP